MKHLLVIAACVAFIGCPPPSPSPPPPPDATDSAAPSPPPPPVVDATPAPPKPVQDAGAAIVDAAPDHFHDGSVLGQMCAKLEWLGCPEAADTPGDPKTNRPRQTCEQVYAPEQNFPNLKLPFACIMSATSQMDVRNRCKVKCGAK